MAESGGVERRLAGRFSRLGRAGALGRVPVLGERVQLTSLKVEGAGPFGALRLEQLRKLIVFGNTYGVDTWGDLTVGDFDGDGHADVFAWTGTTWVYSPWGHREWRFLNASRVSFSHLAFGDFNGDGKTDVFTQRGDQWLVSYSGTSGWQPLPAGSAIPMRDYRFGDFDGD